MTFLTTVELFLPVCFFCLYVYKSREMEDYMGPFGSRSCSEVVLDSHVESRFIVNFTQKIDK